MKTIENSILIVFLGSVLVLSIIGCKKLAVVFPDQIETEDDGALSKPRGPVKQSSFKVITAADGLVKFDLANIDKDNVKTVFFSYNMEGEPEVTEVSNFDDFYIIKNLSYEVPTNIDVWALGINGLESTIFTYVVTALRFPGTIVLESLEFQSVFGGVKLSLTNHTETPIQLMYKVDNSTSFLSVNIPSQILPVQILIDGLTSGNHEITYFIVDENNTETNRLTKAFTTLGLVELPKEFLNADASSFQAVDNGSGNSDAVIDGDLNTFWLSEPNEEYDHWLDIGLDKERLIRGIALLRRKDSTTGSFKKFRIEYYDALIDDYVYIDRIFNFNSLDQPAEFQRYEFEEIKTDYIRIEFIEPINSAVQVAELAEIKIYEVN